MNGAIGRKHKHIVLDELKKKPYSVRELEERLDVTEAVARNVIVELRRLGCGIAYSGGKYVLMFVPDGVYSNMVSASYVKDILDVLQSDEPRVEWTNQEIADMLCLSFSQVKYALSRIESHLGCKIERKKLRRSIWISDWFKRNSNI